MGVPAQAGAGIAAMVHRSSPRALRILVTLGLFLLASAAARQAAAQDIHLIVIVGVGGDEEHSEKFHKWASAIVDSAKKHGLAESNILYLGEQPDKDPARIRGRATKES